MKSIAFGTCARADTDRNDIIRACDDENGEKVETRAARAVCENPGTISPNLVSVWHASGRDGGWLVTFLSSAPPPVQFAHSRAYIQASGIRSRCTLSRVNASMVHEGIQVQRGPHGLGTTFFEVQSVDGNGIGFPRAIAVTVTADSGK